MGRRYINIQSIRSLVGSLFGKCLSAIAYTGIKAGYSLEGLEGLESLEGLIDRLMVGHSLFRTK